MGESVGGFGLDKRGFILFLLSTSNPFLRQFQVLDTPGRDLNPLLQDPGFLFHPPMLYMGYVGFSIAFAFAIAALWAGKVEANWSKWTRPWTLAAWCCLTCGITLGSWWAYRELGWGLVVLGPCGKRFIHAVVGWDSLIALSCGNGTKATI